MIPAILIIGLALAWLGIESDWLRVNLMSIDLEDIEPDYDGSDYVYLDDYDLQLIGVKESYQFDLDYQKWIDKRHEVKYTWQPQQDYSNRREWHTIADDLTTRRLGEALYQRVR